MNFLRSGCIPVESLDLNLFLLIYADDLVIFSDTVVGLQTQLNSLEVYCKELSLKINVQKTTIVIFRNGAKLYDNEKFHINNNTEIEVVNKFTYLGLCFIEEQIISGCPIDGAISVRVDCGFGSYRWFVYITTLLLRDVSWILILHCGTPERPQRHLYC